MSKKGRKKLPGARKADPFPTVQPHFPITDVMPIGEVVPKSETDVLGSYTGVPADGGQPVQDADDL